MSLLAAKPDLTTEMLAAQLGVTKRTVLTHITKLKAQEKLKRVGPNKGGYWQVIAK